MPSPKHFLQFKDLGRDELEFLFGRTRWIKQQFKAYRPHHPLFDRTLVMIFEKQSTRTRLSFEAGLLINVTADTVVRLLPPLNMKDAEVQLLIDGVSSVIKAYLTASKADASVVH